MISAVSSRTIVDAGPRPPGPHHRLAAAAVSRSFPLGTGPARLPLGRSGLLHGHGSDGGGAAPGNSPGQPAAAGFPGGPAAAGWVRRTLSSARFPGLLRHPSRQLAPPEAGAISPPADGGPWRRGLHRAGGGSDQPVRLARAGGHQRLPADSHAPHRAQPLGGPPLSPDRQHRDDAVSHRRRCPLPAAGKLPSRCGDDRRIRWGGGPADGRIADQVRLVSERLLAAPHPVRGP